MGPHAQPGPLAHGEVPIVGEWPDELEPFLELQIRDLPDCHGCPAAHRVTGPSEGLLKHVTSELLLKYQAAGPHPRDQSTDAKLRGTRREFRKLREEQVAHVHRDLLHV